MTPGIETALDIIVNFVGVAMIFALGNIIYTLATKQVTTARWPVYWFRIPWTVTLVILYGNYVVVEYWEGSGLPRGLTAIGTVMIFLLVAADLNLSLFIDRVERNQIFRREVEHEVEKTVE